MWRCASWTYSASSTTDNNGFYNLNVANGIWNVNLDCNGLSNMGYACPSNQMTNISNASGIVNFTVQPFTSVPRPILTSPTWLGSGGFRFILNTVAGVNYTVEWSTTLSNWFTLNSLIGNGGPVPITDPGVTGSPTRYYRVRTGP